MRDRDLPIIAAPMAGGPSTIALARAVSGAGGLGFLASGTQKLEQLKQTFDEIAARGPFTYGLNFFSPQPPNGVEDLRQAASLAQQAYAAQGKRFTAVEVDHDFDFEDKIELTEQAVQAGYGPAVVSMSFGSFYRNEVSEWHELGVEAWSSVTSIAEAESAVSYGIDALIIQGYEAGGHRLSWDPFRDPGKESTLSLLRQCVERGFGERCDLIAAGGVRNARDTQILLQAGAQAVSCGSAFLLSPEAGTSQANRALLATRHDTIASRGFSGRVARGLKTAFAAQDNLPMAYPELGEYLKPLREVPGYEYCLVGVRADEIQSAPAADIARSLTPSEYHKGQD